LYDNAGNLIQKTTDGTSTTYVWDYANRLIALGVGGAGTTTYGYDVFGSRVLQAGTTTTYIYPSKFYSIASSTLSGAKYATTTEYIFNGDTLLSTIDRQTASGVATGSPQTLFMHPDHLGSTNVVTNASGTVVQTLDYYPYGALRINSTVGGADSGRKYVNRFADQSTLDYMNARYYDPNRGQFISQDPTFWSLKMNLNDPQSLNSYSYANDNPITKSDPDGLAATIAQQIAVLQAQVQYLQGVVALYKGGFTQDANNAFAAYQTTFGSGGSGSGNNGKNSGPTGGGGSPTNITNPLTNQMYNHASDFRINNPWYFKKKVETGGEWDLKNNPMYPEFNSKTHPEGFIFNGREIRSDAPGNIHYGFTGAEALWATPQFLLNEAGKNQVERGNSQPQWQNQSFHGDDPVDQAYSLYGMWLNYDR
jgi:RHS repeat-associated protein